MFLEERINERYSCASQVDRTQGMHHAFKYLLSSYFTSSIFLSPRDTVMILGIILFGGQLTIHEEQIREKRPDRVQ